MNEKENKKNQIERKSFELEGNVASFNEIYTGMNGKSVLRFDLAQNYKENLEYIPIVLKGNLAKTYGEKIKVGDWLNVKGKISSYIVEKGEDDKKFKRKVIEIIGFELTDKNKKLVYKYDGSINEMERENGKGR